MKPNFDPSGSAREYRRWRKSEKLQAKANRRAGQRQRAQGNVCAETAGKTEREVRQARARELRAREALKRPTRDEEMRRVLGEHANCSDPSCSSERVHYENALGQQMLRDANLRDLGPTDAPDACRDLTCKREHATNGRHLEVGAANTKVERGVFV